MISGVLTLYPRFGNKGYVESITKEGFRHLPCVTTNGVNIYITITDEMYQMYNADIANNNWGNTTKFRVWGEIKSVNEVTEGYGLSNLYMRVNLMLIDKSDKTANVFSINAHGTKTIDEESDELYNYFYVAANKNILNQYEKRNKPSYGYLQTSKKVHYKDKDIIQGTIKLIEVNEEIRLLAVHTVGFSSCRKLVEAYLPKYQEAS